MSGTDSHTYAVECYEPGVEQAAAEGAARRARDAAATLRAEGHQVEHLNTLLMPEDEIVFYLFAADAPETVREASERAEVTFERVLEVVSVRSPDRSLQK